MTEVPRRPLGEVAPKNDAPMPAETELVWNLSLEDIESGTGRVLRRQQCAVQTLGSAKCSFDERHVLYSKLRPYLNKVVLPDGPGVGTSELLPLLPDSSRLDREYLSFYLRSPQFVDYAVANSRGANLPRVAMRALWDHEVPLPLVGEQRRIVARIKECIDRIEELRVLRQQVAKETAALLPSSLAVSFADLKAVYSTEMIGDCLTESKYGTNHRCGSDVSGVPVLRIPNVANGEIGLDDLKYCKLPDRELVRVRLTDGDVLIVRTNGSPNLVGRCAVFREADRPFAFASYLIRLRVDRHKLHPDYLVYFLTSTMGRDAIAKIRRTSAGQYNINSENLRAIELPLPPLAVQKKTVERLTELKIVAKAIAGDSAARAAEANLLMNAVLRKAFAGEL